MPNIACIMMQKNEDLLIELWIIHHAELFGLENLYIFDNGSDSDHVLNVLKRYEAAGMNVFWDNSTPRHFDLKGWVVGDLIKELEKQAKYDFFFPLDCDEFVALAEKDCFTVSRNKILGFLHTKLSCDKVLRVNHCLLNVPGSINVFGVVSHIKSILPAGRFKFIDHGFHVAERDGTGNTFQSTPLIYLHLHNKPFPMLLQHAKYKLEPYVDVDNREELRKFDGVGSHLKKYFFGFESFYMSSLNSAVRVKFEGLGQRAAAFRLNDFIARWTAVQAEDIIAARPNASADGQIVTDDDDIDCLSEEAEIPSIITYLLDKHHEARRLVDAIKQSGLDAIRDRRWDVALEKWSTVRCLAPFEAESYAMCILAYREAALYDEAEALANLAMVGFPDSYQLLLERALITFPTKQWKQGKIRFDELRRRFPDESEGYSRGIEIAINLGNFLEAQRLREIGIKRFGILSKFEEQTRPFLST